MLATWSDLEPCEHDKEGFALWISSRPGYLLCGFCYQAAQGLAERVGCAACANPAGDPSRDAVIIAKLSDNLGTHMYMCSACADDDMGS